MSQTSIKPAPTASNSPEDQHIPYPTGKDNGCDELFDAIQDLVLVVTPKGIIIDANLAAINAARKPKDQILGRGICKIIHGGSSPHLQCPLESFLRTCTPRV